MQNISTRRSTEQTHLMMAQVAAQFGQVGLGQSRNTERARRHSAPTPPSLKSATSHTGQPIGATGGAARIVCQPGLAPRYIGFPSVAGTQPVYRPWPLDKRFAIDAQERRYCKPIDDIDILCRSYNARGVHDFIRPQGVGGMHEAVRVLEGARTVWLATGFNVAENMPETDGPPGLATLGHALWLCGKNVRFVCDSRNLALVHAAVKTLDAQAASEMAFSAFDAKDDAATAQATQLFADHACDAFLALELTGRNVHGKRLNMRGINVNRFNAAVDECINQANRLGKHTIAVGDGMNEGGTGGTGNVPLALNGKSMAAAIAAQSQVYAWNSNLGGLALAEILLARAGRSEASLSAQQLGAMIEVVMANGAVDGVTREPTGVDGFAISTHQEDLGKLKKLARAIEPLKPRG